MGMSLSFNIWFMLTIIFTFFFIGSYRAMTKDRFDLFVMAVFVCLGLSVFTPLKDKVYFEIRNFYVVYPMVCALLTTLFAEKILKNYRS